MQIIKVEQIEQIEQSESKIPWIKAECLAKKARTVWWQQIICTQYVVKHLALAVGSVN